VEGYLQAAKKRKGKGKEMREGEGKKVEETMFVRLGSTGVWVSQSAARALASSAE
jgi:hypothetical protein